MAAKVLSVKSSSFIFLFLIQSWKRSITTDSLLILKLQILPFIALVLLVFKRFTGSFGSSFYRTLSRSCFLVHFVFHCVDEIWSLNSLWVWPFGQLPGPLLATCTKSIHPTTSVTVLKLPILVDQLQVQLIYQLLQLKASFSNLIKK
jgi:hypothetical protein